MIDFNTVNILYNSKQKKYKIIGDFGTNFIIATNKAITSKTAKTLFINYSSDSIEFYSFFLFEVYHLFKNIDNYDSFQRKNINVKTIANLVTDIEEQIFKNNIEHREILDYNHITTTMKFSILEHQKTAFDKYTELKSKYNYRGFILDAATGSGKTFMSLALTEGLRSDIVVIIAPLPTIDKVWLNSINNELYKDKQSVYTVGSKKPYNNEKFILTHYEAIDKLPVIAKTSIKKISVIVDEIHNFTTLNTKRTQGLLAYIDELNTNDIILMSGTPIKATTAEVIPLFRLIDPGFNKVIEKRFKNIYKTTNSKLAWILPLRYTEYRAKIEKKELKLKPHEVIYFKQQVKNGEQYTLTNIAKDMETYYADRKKYYNDNMERYTFDYTRLYTKVKDMLLSSKKMPSTAFKTYEKDIDSIKKYYKRRLLSMYPDLLKRVNKFEKDIITANLAGEDKKVFNASKSVVKYVNLKIRGEVLANIIMRARINADIAMAKTVDYISIINSTTKKTLVFSNYIEVCDVAYNRLTDSKYNPRKVYGEELKNFNYNVGSFNTDESVNPLVATFKSLSTGVPLIAANVILIIGLPFRMYTYEQAIARAWRLGQDKKVYIYIAELDTGDEPNISTRGIDIITFFNEEVERITGDKSTTQIIKTIDEPTLSLEDDALCDDMQLPKTNISYGDYIYIW